MCKHIHCDLIKAWADGTEIQVRKPIYGRQDTFEWCTVHNPVWSNRSVYRIKPIPVVVKYKRALYKNEMGYFLFTHDYLSPNLCESPLTSEFVRWIDHDWQEYVIADTADLAGTGA